MDGVRGTYLTDGNRFFWLNATGSSTFLDPAPGDAPEILSVFVDCVGRTRIVHALAQEPVEVLALPLSIVRVDVALVRNTLFFVGRDFHHSEVAVAVAAPWRVFARDPEGGAMRVGMRREHHEVMVVTAGLI